MSPVQFDCCPASQPILRLEPTIILQGLQWGGIGGYSLPCLPLLLLPFHTTWNAPTGRPGARSRVGDLPPLFCFSLFHFPLTVVK